MRTLKLLTLIVAFGLISLSCSNEEINSPIDEAAVNNVLFKGKPTIRIDPNPYFNNDLIVTTQASFEKGKLILTLNAVAGTDPIDSIEVNGEIWTSPGSGGTVNVTLSFNTGIKKKDMIGSQIPVKIVFFSGHELCFYYQIVNNKFILIRQLVCS